MTSLFLSQESDDDEEDDDVVIPTLPEVLENFNAIQSAAALNHHHHSLADKETNTECVFVQPSGSPATWSNNQKVLQSQNRGKEETAVQALVKRSQTFSPSAPINKSDYICKV